MCKKTDDNTTEPIAGDTRPRYGDGSTSPFDVQQGKDLFLEPLTLPCGVTLSNRLAKAPMSEERADADGRPNRNLVEMYRAWAHGGFGLNVTGNFIVSHTALVAPGNVVCEKSREDGFVEYLKVWSAAAQENGTACWVQICHAGRQTSSENPVAPSAVPLPWGPPVRALTEDEIEDIIQRFVDTAVVCKEGGFQGVQIHCAHGYLLSQFLSPLVNQRTDQWGGSLENRARMSLEIVRRVRHAVGAAYPIGVKINSADFQRGGFEEGEALQFVQWLEEASVDLIEVSGGTYEQLSMTDGSDGRITDVQVSKESSQKREAYFLEFSKQLVATTKVPVMCTGGWRSRDAMLQALHDKETHLIGIGRPAIEADLPNKLIDGSVTGALVTRHLEGVANFSFCQINFDRMAMGLAPDTDLKLTSEEA